MEKTRFRENKGQIDGPIDKNIIGELVNQEANDNIPSKRPNTTKSKVDADPNSPAAELLKKVREAAKRRPKFD